MQYKDEPGTQSNAHNIDGDNDQYIDDNVVGVKDEKTMKEKQDQLLEQLET